MKRRRAKFRCAEANVEEQQGKVTSKIIVKNLERILSVVVSFTVRVSVILNQ